MHVNDLSHTLVRNRAPRNRQDRRWLTLLTLCLAVLIAQLDTSVVNLAVRPIGAGIALMPMALVFVTVSPFSGALASMLGQRFMTAGGVAVIGCGLLLIGATADAPSIFLPEIGLALTGLGMGFATGQLMDAAVGAASAARSGTAAALINVARMAGATIGVAVLGTVFALADGGPQGLQLAMLVGGAAQLATAAVAWIAMRSE